MATSAAWPLPAMAAPAAQPDLVRAPDGSLLLSWVEHGDAPDKVIAEKRDANGKVTRTRPLFPYPQTAKYKGSGSTDEEKNFRSNDRN